MSGHEEVDIDGGIRSGSSELACDPHLAKVKQTYQTTAMNYDAWNKDYEEKVHGHIRAAFIPNLRGNVLEVGVGTGSNLPYYTRGETVVTGVDLSDKMLARAKHKVPPGLSVRLMEGDATNLAFTEGNEFDSFVAYCVFCVLPKHLLPQAIEEMTRALKPGGKFSIVDIVQSQEHTERQTEVNETAQTKERYCLDVTNDSAAIIQLHPSLQIKRKIFVHRDTFLLIEGIKVANDTDVPADDVTAESAASTGQATVVETDSANE